MALAIDEEIRTELAAVVAGRGLGASGAAWLARALVGAVRPNRDLPLLDLARTLASLSRVEGDGDVRALLRLAFDPALARPAAIQDHVEAALGAAPEGAVLPSPERPVPYGLMARSLALAELLALVDGSALLPDLVEALRRVAADPSPASVEDAARGLARALHAWRMRRLPFAAVERGLRRLAAAGLDATPGDDTILDLFRAEIAAGERPVFHALARLVATLERARRYGLDLRRLAEARPLDAAPEVETALADIAGGVETSLEERLDRVPARPKCLTGVERRELQALTALDPLHRLRPLTTLRALAFEPVQAGILNRQRRGAGGPSAAARASACDAPAYPDLAAGLGRLRDHLRDVLRIALALRLDAGADGPDDPRAAAVAAEGRRLLKTLRREGFDAPVLELRQALAGIDGDLAALAGALDDALGAIAALDGARPLAARFAADRAIFAALFTALYADPSAQEALDGTP